MDAAMGKRWFGGSLASHRRRICLVVCRAGCGIGSSGCARRARRVLFFLLALSLEALGQVPPTAQEVAAYTGLQAAAQAGDAATIRTLAASGAALNARDARGRTPLHVATCTGVRPLASRASSAALAAAAGCGRRAVPGACATPDGRAEPPLDGVAFDPPAARTRRSISAASPRCAAACRPR
jgi:hypothetical protein